jgi:predicted secreted Zn-dependent protease
MRSFLVFLGILSILSAAIWFGRSGPNVAVREDSSTAGIWASSYDGILTELATVGPNGHWGVVYWRYHIKPPEFEKTDQGCKIIRQPIIIELTRRTPTLSWMARPSQCLRQNFETMRQALELHENGHLAIAKNEAANLESDLSNLQDAPNCDLLAMAISQTIENASRRHAKRQADYDAQTHHGLTQGVVFAPCNPQTQDNK